MGIKMFLAKIFLMPSYVQISDYLRKEKLWGKITIKHIDT